MAERKDRKCWIVGRDAKVDATGAAVGGITGPLIVFDDEATARQAADMVKHVSGEKPVVVEGSLWRERQPRERRAKAVQS